MVVYRDKEKYAVLAIWKLIRFAMILLWILIFVVVSRSDLPGFEELENPQYDLASIIYDANEVAFGKYYIENREFIDYEDLSPEEAHDRLKPVFGVPFAQRKRGMGRPTKKERRDIDKFREL